MGREPSGQGLGHQTTQADKTHPQEEEQEKAEEERRQHGFAWGRGVLVVVEGSRRGLRMRGSRRRGGRHVGTARGVQLVLCRLRGCGRSSVRNVWDDGEGLRGVYVGLGEGKEDKTSKKKQREFGDDGRLNCL